MLDLLTFKEQENHKPVNYCFPSDWNSYLQKQHLRSVKRFHLVWPLKKGQAISAHLCFFHAVLTVSVWSRHFKRCVEPWNHIDLLDVFIILIN